jgi:hypothetical protein
VKRRRENVNDREERACAVKQEKVLRGEPCQGVSKQASESILSVRISNRNYFQVLSCFPLTHLGTRISIYLILRFCVRKSFRASTCCFDKFLKESLAEILVHGEN